MRPLLVVTVLFSLVQPGCLFLFDDDCTSVGQPERIANPGLRNPDTGQCEFFGGGGGGDTCGDFGSGAADEVVRDWGACVGACSGLDEQSCLDSPGCRAAYTGDCPDTGACDQIAYTFAECWEVAPSGPVQGGDCSALDAYQCSRHDDCVALHFAGSASGDRPSPPPPGIGPFASCASERSGTGESCYGEVLCDGLPPQCPPNTQPAILDGCFSGACIPVEQCEPAPSCDVVPSEAACVAQDTCAPIYRGEDCTCDPSGVCSCQTRIYQRCQAT